MTGPSSAQPRLLRGRELCALLNIGKSTLQPWRDKGLVEFVELPNGDYRYPENQQAVQRALAALGRCARTASQ